jgi:hypothetical protein
MDEGQVKRFIYSRAHASSHLRAVIAVAVQRYPSEFSVTIWVGDEPTPEMRQFALNLEAELANLGVPCSILIKSDRTLPFGGTHELRTPQGVYSYRYFKLDPVKDEDVVYVFSAYKGPDTYRFRISLSRTLASTLRARNRMDEERIFEVYLDRVKQLLATTPPNQQAEPQEIMFTSKDLGLFANI